MAAVGFFPAAALEGLGFLTATFEAVFIFLMAAGVGAGFLLDEAVFVSDFLASPLDVVAFFVAGVFAPAFAINH